MKLNEILSHRIKKEKEILYFKKKRKLPQIINCAFYPQEERKKKKKKKNKGRDTRISGSVTCQQKQRLITTNAPFSEKSGREESAVERLLFIWTDP